MDPPGTPNVFLENLVVLHDISTKQSKQQSPIGESGILFKAHKSSLLIAADAANNLCERMLNISEGFLKESAHFDSELILELAKESPNKQDLERLETMTIWSLNQAKSYKTTARSYLKQAKRLRRRAWWMRG